MCDLSIPSNNGYVAKTIGTAPRNPTQEIYNFLLRFILKKNKAYKNTQGAGDKYQKYGNKHSNAHVGDNLTWKYQ